MKKLLTLAVFPLLSSCIFGCGGTPEPPFEYIENSRMVVEGQLKDENSLNIANQLVMLTSSSSGHPTVITTAISKADGTFFISSPIGNNAMKIEFEGKNIVGLPNNPAPVPFIELQYDASNYFNLRVIRLKQI